MANNVWQHIAYTVDFSKMKCQFYINGQLHSEKNLVYKIDTSQMVDQAWIGAYDPNSYLWNNFIGNIDEVKIYDRALSAGEIRTLYSGFNYTSSGINGIVNALDTQGNVQSPLQGASVDLDGTAVTTTDSAGQFQLPNVSSGSHTITVSKTGYYPITRNISIDGGGTQTEIFNLALQSSSGAPVSFGFESSAGSHVIPGMSSNINFSTEFAWGGTPGTVRLQVDGAWETPAIADHGDGTASAALILSAPSSIGACSEITLEVTNGEGKRTFVNTGVHYLPLPVIPFYRDNIAWTPSNLALSYSEGQSLSFPNLSIGSDKLQLDGSLGYNIGFKYDILSASLSGTLSGTGGLGYDFPGPYHPEVKIPTKIGINISGGLTISFAGCSPPNITPSWSLGFSGEAGIKAPVVLGLDIIAPPLGSFLAYIPGINSPRLQLALLVNGESTAVYDDFATGSCFLGSTGTTGSYGGGLEGTALIEFGDIEGGVYVGGTGTLGVGTCPDITLREFTGQVYAGAYSKLYGLETKKEFAVEIAWDWTSNGTQPKLLAYDDFGIKDSLPNWQPIGASLDKWGAANNLANYKVKLSADQILAKELTGTDEQLLVSNVIGLASPSVIADATQSDILYSHHDTTKPWYAATDIGKIVRDSTGNLSSSLVTDDQAAEFTPATISISNDAFLAAWTRISGDISSATSPDDIAPHLEVVSSIYKKSTDSWSAIEVLTNNSQTDRLPLPIASQSKYGIVWIQNQGGALTGSATSGDSLQYREWAGTAWSSPQTLYTASKGIIGYTIAVDSAGEFYMAFTVDEDGDEETKTDRELYLAKTVSGTWQAAIQLTSDSVEDSLPVLTTPDGAPLLAWKSGETLKYSSISTWNSKEVFTEATLYGEAPTLAGTTLPGGAAIAYTIQTEAGVDIVASFYDAALDVWSLPIQLTGDEHAESSLDLTFNGDELVIAYLKTQTLRQDIEVVLDGKNQTIPNVPQPGKTDLYVLHHLLGQDLAVASESLVILPANPGPNTPVTISTDIFNAGDAPVDSVPVTFYYGDPNDGGIVIAEIATPGNLIAGGKQNIEVSWQMPQSITTEQFYVVIDPEVSLEDRNRGNNTASLVVSLPDLAVSSARSEQIRTDTIALTAKISNSGAIPSGECTVSWRLGAIDGPEIATEAVSNVLPGATTDVLATWVAGSTLGANEYSEVHVVIDYANAVEEFNEENNTALQSVRRPYTTGSITFNIQPHEAAAAGVQWSVDGANWHDSGTTVILPSGRYVVQFSSVPGWSLSAMGNVDIEGTNAVTLSNNPDQSGDLNGDSQINLIDAIVSLQISAGGNGSPTGSWYDVDGDLQLGVAEAIDIMLQISEE